MSWYLIYQNGRYMSPPPPGGASPAGIRVFGNAAWRFAGQTPVEGYLWKLGWSREDLGNGDRDRPLAAGAIQASSDGFQEVGGPVDGDHGLVAPAGIGMDLGGQGPAAGGNQGPEDLRVRKVQGEVEGPGGRPPAKLLHNCRPQRRGQLNREQPPEVVGGNPGEGLPPKPAKGHGHRAHRKR